MEQWHGKIRAAAMAAVALAAASAVHGATPAEPTLPKTVRIVVPFSAGGSNDLFARALGQRIAGKFNVTVVVDNKPGAGGAIGSDMVARAEPDGGTLLLTSVSFSTNAAVQPKLPYDPLKSFAPVALVSRGPMLLVVGNQTPYKSTAELLAAARAQQGKFNYASAGIGSIGQMGGELLNAMGGTQVQHVPYKGISNAVSDMIGGNVEMMVTTTASVNGPLKAGSIRPIAVTSLERSKFAPDLPAVSEALPGYAVEAWWGVFAPARTPKALVDRLNAEIRAAGQTEELRELYARESTEAGTMTADQFAAFVASEVSKWRKLAKERNITAE
ncbi:tripartite tricarboxylate transporter substrate binding protein [Aquincola sp. MAHUQ-54]|uniref:Tripartite tricarboxylate transporter substrate binding protein n=1 Tax=Aquincola agrisoli TaxID=3119538 RepID=A0AAW9Q203_9BURK